MKTRIACLAVVVFAVTNIYAQQRPYYTQYILNNYIINPAVAGIENYWDAKVSSRLQWVGLDGAPVTTYFTIQGPLTKSAYPAENPTSFHPSGENPRGEAYWNEYQKADPHVGLGFDFVKDQTGPLSNTYAHATVAYHLGVAPRTSLAGGISIGFNQVTLNADQLHFADGSTDPAVSGSGILNKIRPDISAGLWLYSRDYFIGVSAQQIVPQPLTFASSSTNITVNSNGTADTTTIKQTGQLVPHIFVSAGYRFLLSEDFNLLPSVQFRYITPLPLGFDVNVKLQYQDIIWGGFSCRYQDGYSVMLGVNLSHTLNIGYSYDYTTSELNAVSGGSHEFLLGFLIGNKYGDWCPRSLW